VLQFTKRDINHRTAQVLDQIAAERAPAVITERGTPRWRIEPILPPSASPLEQAIRDGRVQPRSDYPPPWPPRRPSDRTSEQIDQLVAEIKGDL
jgi:antitoxin (DNA-binding transcriptional repressor) of toxin-antitoxin stability system